MLFSGLLVGEVRQQLLFSTLVYLAIIPQARMGYRGYEGSRNNCFSKIQLVDQKSIETKHLSQVKARHQSFFTPKHYKYGGRFSLPVGYKI